QIFGASDGSFIGDEVGLPDEGHQDSIERAVTPSGPGLVEFYAFQERHDVDFIRRTSEDDSGIAREVRSRQIDPAESERFEGMDQTLTVRQGRLDDDVHVVGEARVAVVADRVASDHHKDYLMIEE